MKERTLFEGTKREDNWFFYHDVLSQTTSNTAFDWMKEKMYYSSWLLTHLDLNRGTLYAGCAVGNFPESMPLDNSHFNKGKYDYTLCNNSVIT